MPLLKYRLDRRSPRVIKPMAITVWDAEDDSTIGLAGAILDLSDHGLRVATKGPLNQGQTILVMLNDTGLCYRRCRVIWTRPKPTPEFSQSGLAVLR